MKSIFLTLALLFGLSCLVNTDEQVKQNTEPAPNELPAEHSDGGDFKNLPEEGSDEIRPEVYDFKSYKRMFHKHYDSLAEESARSKLYLMRALKVSNAWMRYSLGHSSFYLRLNRMSDWTDEERAQLNSVGASTTETPAEMHQLVGKTDHLRIKRGLTDHMKAANLDKVGGLSKFLKKAVQIVSASSSGRHVIQGSQIDLRKTNCFTTPMFQGDCHSCYAIAAVALYEYLYCRVHKTRVQFSPQYIVDCGLPFGMSGCDGGRFSHVDAFAKIMGFELESNYPYRADDSRGCPYGSNSNREVREGVIRAASGEFIEAPYEDWEDWLRKKVPLYIIILIGPSFEDYGGGVDDQEDCDLEGDQHAVVLVGQGHENGLDYWLIRNSRGSDWGLGGYYKIVKSSICVLQTRLATAPGGFMSVSKKAFVGAKLDNKSKMLEPLRTETSEIISETSSDTSDTSSDIPGGPPMPQDKPTQPDEVSEEPPSEYQPIDYGSQEAQSSSYYSDFGQYPHGDNQEAQSSSHYSDFGQYPHGDNQEAQSSSYYSDFDQYPHGDNQDQSNSGEGWHYDSQYGCQVRTVRDPWG